MTPIDEMPIDEMMPEEVLITYVDVEPIFAANCVECHGDVGFQGGFMINSFERASGNAGRIIARMSSEVNPMPPRSAGGQLDQELIDTVAQWIEDGLLEN